MIYGRNFGRYILYAGLFFHMMGVNINKNVVLIVMSVANVILLLPGLWMPFRRYGPDYMAYIN